MIVKLTLPCPISVNAAYANSFNSGGKGRFKTGDYKNWEKDAAGALARYDITAIKSVTSLAKLKKKKPNQEIWVKYCYSFRDTRPRDICNYEKVLTDFLVHQFLIYDDSMITKALLERIEAGNNLVDVTIKYIDLDNKLL